MKAVVLRQTGTPGVLQCEDIPEPHVGPEDVLIRTTACGVCFHDIVVRNGTLKYGVKLPTVLGHEVSGIIAALGQNVRTLKVGQRVATVSHRSTCGYCRECREGLENLCAHKEVLGDAGLNGGYAELVAVDQRSVSLVPDNIDLELASIVGCAAGCQLNAVRNIGRVTIGDSVLVTGAGGGVGVHGVQLARRLGGYVIALTASPAKASRLKEIGAHEVIVAHRDDDFSKRVRDLTSKRGVDIVIDNVGGSLFHPTRRSLAPGGRWVLVGQVTGDFVSFNPAQLFLRGISMLSATGARKRHLDDALQLVCRGDLRPIVHASFPFAEAPLAHAAVENSQAIGRIIVRPR